MRQEGRVAEQPEFVPDPWQDDAERWQGGRCVDPWPCGEQVRHVTLALQGGGAHGAFTWGVLDRLLEDDRIAIEGVSGTSAGAMNATLLAYGLALGGRAEARARLHSFWQRAALLAAWSPLQPTGFDRLLGLGRMDFSPAWHWLDIASRLFSPYQFNPLNLDPVRALLTDLIDFDFLHGGEAMKIYICATNVKRGRMQIFSGKEVSVDAVMASACLPFMSQAVEIDGEHYWDGGYLGNPAIYPVMQGCAAQDVILVQINPMRIDTLPTSAQEILDRLNTLTFNAGLIREMRAIDLITRLIDSGKVVDGSLKRFYLHRIADEQTMASFGASSKMNADWPFLWWLRERGRATAEDWLKENYDALGQRSSLSIPDIYI
jgi:NTE family protein